MTKKQKKWLARIVIAGFIFAVLMVLEHSGFGLAGIFQELPWYVRLPIFAVPYLIVGYDVLVKAAKNISHGQVFDENFLMMIATFGAFGVGEYSEAVVVMLFYQVGELFQNYAVGKSRESITAMMEIVPEYANIEEDGKLVQVDPDDVEVGTIITILPGERVPIDGIIREGESALDTSALTGESVPRTAKTGDEIISGCVNGSGTLRVETTKEFDDSTVAKILELVENASIKKAKMENFITRFAKYYTPVVTIGALLLAIIPPIFVGGWTDWLLRACIFLVISCPCALVISVPLGFFGGIGASSRIGVLVKGSNYLEACGLLDTVVFDKTGTLTKGEFRVSDIHAKVQAQNNVLEVAAAAEHFSTHPIAVSICEEFERRLASGDISEGTVKVSTTSEVAGEGIVADGDILVGNDKLMKRYGIDFEVNDDIGTVIYVAKEGRFLGSITIADSIKDGVKEAVTDLKNVGIKRTVMLTGDHKNISERVASEIGVDEVRAELLPGDKVSEFESLMGNGKVAFVGDGINDAPVLTRADIGFAMGSMGSDAAIEAADIVIMDDDLSKIARVIRIARKTVRIVRENIVFALAVKFIVLLLGALGIANMWAAVFADVGVAVLAILNSMRTLRSSGAKASSKLRKR